jgi:hypothetical protein
MTARMTTFAPELDLLAFSLAVLAAVLAPLAMLVDGAAAGRMRALVCICHRNLLRRSLRLKFVNNKKIRTSSMTNGSCRVLGGSYKAP